MTLRRVVCFVLLASSGTACMTGGHQQDTEAVGGERLVDVIDLSHKLTTFGPSPATAADKRFAADLTKPVGASHPVSAFSDQMVLVHDPDVPTGDGVFKLNTTVLPENIGTSIDTGAHFVATRPEVSRPDQRGLAELTVDDLTGPVVVIDISARVEAELRKNNGSPGPVEITNFGNTSANVVTAADIDAVADQIRDRSFVIAHTGWSRFYSTSGPGLEGPYVNGFNFPGFSREAVARLIDIETSQNIRINGSASITSRWTRAQTQARPSLGLEPSQRTCTGSNEDGSCWRTSPTLRNSAKASACCSSVR